MDNSFQGLIDPSKVSIEINDIQAIILRNRPAPYYGTNVLLGIDGPQAGKEILMKLLPHVNSAGNLDQSDEAIATVAISFKGLEVLGLPQESLDSFPEKFRAGMAGRAKELRYIDENDPKNWQKPFGTETIHIAVSIIANTKEKWLAGLDKAAKDLEKITGVTILVNSDFAAGTTPDDVKNVFGFRDGISNPEIEGSGIDGKPGYGRPIKAGEFILGYPGEAGTIGFFPKPDILGKNGTFMAFGKYHSKVFEFNKYLHAKGKTEAERELLAAKMFGRWRSGAPLLLAPEKDDPILGADQHKNNDFSYEDDKIGKTVPLSCHLRRMNPRDTKLSVINDMNLHRIIRKGVSYGTMPDTNVIEDDGQERGLYFLGISAKVMDTMEFLQSWVEDGNFINHGDEKDPIIGLNQGKGVFTVPGHEVRRRYTAVETFNIMQGGEYFFLPGLRALKWISEL